MNEKRLRDVKGQVMEEMTGRQHVDRETDTGGLIGRASNREYNADGTD